MNREIFKYLIPSKKLGLAFLSLIYAFAYVMSRLIEILRYRSSYFGRLFKVVAQYVDLSVY